MPQTECLVFPDSDLLFPEFPITVNISFNLPVFVVKALVLSWIAVSISHSTYRHWGYSSETKQTKTIKKIPVVITFSEEKTDNNNYIKLNM